MFWAIMVHENYYRCTLSIIQHYIIYTDLQCKVLIIDRRNVFRNNLHDIKLNSIYVRIKTMNLNINCDNVINLFFNWRNQHSLPLTKS